MADLTSLGIDGAWLYQSEIHGDSRGYFTEWFKHDLIREKTGRDFNIAQANVSKSRKGVVRGIHFSLAKQGQAKWITCTNGVLLDLVVDIRPESDTFKKWVAIELKAGAGNAVMISEGLGHAFLSLEDETVITYLLTTPYSPNEEFAINLLDPDLAIEFPLIELHRSQRDEAAPTLKEFLRGIQL